MIRLPSRGDALLVPVLAGLCLVPVVTDGFYAQLMTKIMILGVFAMSLNLLVGFTGLVSLGHAAFYGLAGYVLVALSPQYEAAGLWTSMAAAAGAAALAALVIGALVLRTSGVYFIMATLAFAQMLHALFAESGLVGGSDGVYIYFKPDPTVLGVKPFDLESTRDFFYVALVVLVVTYLFLRLLVHSPFGRVLAGIRDNEQRMRSLGFSTYRYKLVAFVISGAIAGVAGWLGAAQFGFVSPETLNWRHSGEVLMMVILGGMGSVFGPAAGAFVLIVVQEIFTDLTKHWLLPMGFFIIFSVLALPRGLSGLLRPRRRDQDASDA